MSQQYTIANERLKMREHFNTICSKNQSWQELPVDERYTFSRHMERDCFEATINSCMHDGIDRLWGEKKFLERYSAECYRILSNLDIDSSVGSTYLITGVLNKSINASTVASLSNYELCPDASRAERNEIALRLEVKVDIKVSHTYTCGKCGKNETTVRKFQAKGSDEDNTLSIRCINCNHVWRKN